MLYSTNCESCEKEFDTTNRDETMCYKCKQEQHFNFIKTNAELAEHNAIIVEENIFLKNQLTLHKEALRLACEHILLYGYCPVSIVGFGKIGKNCSNKCISINQKKDCKPTNEAINCWQNYILAKAAAPKENTDEN